MSVVYSLPDMDKVVVKKNLVRKPAQGEAQKLDVYYPPSFTSESRGPAVILVHGGPVPKGVSLKEMT